MTFWHRYGVDITSQVIFKPLKKKNYVRICCIKMSIRWKLALKHKIETCDEKNFSWFVRVYVL